MSTGKTVAIILGVCGGIGVLIIGSCGGLFYVGFKNADATVSPHIDAMFTAIENHTFADTYDNETCKELRDVVSKERYASLGNAVALRLGKFKTKTIRGFNMRQHNAESYVDVTYNATFEKGNGTVNAKLKKQGGEWKFLNFRVNSPVFEQDVATQKCPSCNEPHASNAKFCPSCGKQFSPGTTTDHKEAVTQ